MDNLLLLLIPLFWTGPQIPYPDCVEPVNNSTVILHRSDIVEGCGIDELSANMLYYIRDLGYNITDNYDDPNFPGRGTMTLEKIK